MRLPRVLEAALRWPPFLYSIFCYYWSAVVLGALYKIKWLNFTQKRNDVLGWSSGMKDLHKFTVLKVGNRDLLRVPCMYLCNHRSWADFMVDQYVTEGRSLFMSRIAVAWVFPMFMLPMWAIRCVILFKRGSIADKDAFNKWIDEQFARSPQTGLGIYPEGHRSTHGESLPLKRGMLHYAFSRKLPVQVVIGANKEAILSEKQYTTRFHQTVAVGYSEVVHPEEFEGFEEFMAKIQATWDSEWNAVFGADWEKLPVLPEVDPQFDYPFDIRFNMFLSIVFNFVVFIYLSVVFCRWAVWLLAFLGSMQYPFLGLIAVYLVTSFYVYSKPVDALTVHKNMLKQRKAPKHIVETDGKKMS